MTRLSERNNQTTGGPYAQEDYAGHAFCRFSRSGRHRDRLGPRNDEEGSGTGGSSGLLLAARDALLT